MPLPTQIRGHLGDRKSHKLGVLKQAKDQPAKQEGSNSSDRPAKRPAYEHQDDLRILKGCHGGDRLPTPLASEGYRIVSVGTDLAATMVIMVNTISLGLC